jgi:hypothetical protein
MQTLFCQKHGEFPGPYPAACPTCLAVTGQVTVMCENHGLQVVKPGNSCSFCVMESIVDQPMHRMYGRPNSQGVIPQPPKGGRDLIFEDESDSYFKPNVQRRGRRGR